MTATNFVCPGCGNDTLSTIEELIGYAEIKVYRSEKGNVFKNWEGSTEVDWDTSHSIGIACRTCEWEFRGNDWSKQLVPEHLDEEFED